MERLAFTIQEMQSSSHESGDGSGPSDEIFGSPLLSLASTNSDDTSDSPHILPRVGDKYQVNVPSFKMKMGHDQLGMNRSKDYKGGKAEDFELLFVEGLPVPVMQICCFSPFGNGRSSDNEFHSKESSPIPASKKDCGLSQLDLSEVENDRCTHEIINSDQLRKGNAVCSITDLKTEFLRPKNTATEATVMVESVLDTSYCNGRQRKRGKVGWTTVKKMTLGFLDSNKHCIDSNWQVQQQGTHSTRENASLRSYMIVPGRQSASWSKSEEDLFILGLYIYGKNLKDVQRFVETKEMGDVLSQYYGKFFKTDSYCRWAESRRTRSRKCIQGQRIFSGWRQQELLTRLIPHIPEHLKHEIPEVTKAFNDGRVSMEEFVTKLKTLAGPNVLVQAVGIGKGKEDLTAVLTEPAKTNQVSSSRHEIPMGRACSTLSTEEIIKFLTGDFRLSKARADDLFWEAVWPRLLARGWHSEKPDKALFGLRQPLVFLIPGVHKFSRRDLTKGIHFFDSISEVLSMVASDPRLLELDTHEITGVEVKPECLQASENADEENGHADHPRFYLQPRFNTQVSSLAFTIVDTSLTSQVGPSRIRERVTLPLDDGSDRSEKVSWETEDTDNLELSPSQGDSLSSNSEESTRVVVDHDSSSERNENLGLCKVKAQDSLNCNSEESTRVVVDHESLGERNEIFGSCKVSTPDQWDCLPSPLKRRKLTTCINDKEDIKATNWVESSESNDQTTMLKFNPKEEYPESQPLLGATPLEISMCVPYSTQASAGRSINTTFVSADWPSANRINNNSQNSRICRLIPEIGFGLNLPEDQPLNTMVNSVPVISSPVSEASKSEETSYSEANFGHPQVVLDNSGIVKSSSPGPNESHSTGPRENDGSALQENVRRQSTRIRPLTTRALEAFACDFFSPKRRRKGSEKTLNPDGCRMKSISRRVEDEPTCSLNTCSSESNDIRIGH